MGKQPGRFREDPFPEFLENIPVETDRRVESRHHETLDHENTDDGTQNRRQPERIMDQIADRQGKSKDGITGACRRPGDGHIVRKFQ